MFERAALALTILLSLSGIAAASDYHYHVDVLDGDDNAIGTSPQTAWKTLEKVNSVTFQPGDRILFRAGRRWVGTLRPKGSGTPQDPIVIDRYARGPAPILDGDGVSGVGTGVIRLHNVQGWRIRNVEITNPHPQLAQPHGRNLVCNKFGRGVRLGNGDTVRIVMESDQDETANLDRITLYLGYHLAGGLTFEAEQMEMVAAEVAQHRQASGGKYVRVTNGKGYVQFRVEGLKTDGKVKATALGWVFDESDGQSRYRILVNTTRDWRAHFTAARRAIRSGISVTCDNQAADVLGHFVFEDLKIHNVAGIYHTDQSRMGAGIQFKHLTDDQGKAVRYDDILVDGCTMHDMGCSAVTARGLGGFHPSGSQKWKDARFSRYIVRNNYIDNLSSNGIVFAGADDTCLIERNILHDVGLHDTGNTIVTWHCKGTVMQFNEVYNHKGGGKIPHHEACMYDADGDSADTVWQYSYSHDNANGLIDFCSDAANIHIRYNVSQNDRGNIVQFSRNPKAIIYNNVIFVGEHRSPRILNERRGADRYKFYNNNIIINRSKSASYATSTNGAMQGDFSHNCFFGVEAKNQPKGKHTVGDDPKLLAPGKAGNGLNACRVYQIPPDSPCRDAGKVIQDNGGRDFFGNKLTDGKPDIGIHEFSGKLLPLLNNQSEPDEPDAKQDRSPSDAAVEFFKARHRAVVLREMDGASTDRIEAELTRRAAATAAAHRRNWIQARDLGLTATTRFADVMALREPFNADRRRAAAENRIVYGPVEMTPHMFYDYVYSNLRIKMERAQKQAR